jgi:signal transduction histidine kinase
MLRGIVMKPLRDFSIKAKLSLLGMLTAATALVLACLLFVVNDLSATQTAIVQRQTSLARILGANCAAALTVNDSKAADDVLTSLQHEPMIQAAVVFNRRGERFAAYETPGSPYRKIPVEASVRTGHSFEPDGTLQIVAAIRDNHEVVGTVVLRAGLAQLDARFREQMLTSLFVLVVALALAFLFSTWLQRFVSLPIVTLAATAEQISRKRDFSIRVKTAGNDEIGSLYTAFNRMLERIEQTEADLNRSRDELEARVQDRTARLSEANSGLSHEVAERKKAEHELRSLQSQHIDAARRAGMAEIATSVLHNVGNVLNSVNVSATMIRDKLKKSGADDLKSAVDLLKARLADLGAFFSSDPQGKQLPRFLIQLSQKMSADQALIDAEVKSLTENVEHIKGIVTLQQSYAGISGMCEECSLAGLLDDALRINRQSVDRHRIQIVKQYDDVPPFLAEKQKILQVLVNLISNAKYAVIAAEQRARLITLRLTRLGFERASIEVVDNGVGIPPENLTRIFSHGFTTRKEGHGFGLHSAANLARELGGTLAVKSAGTGQGATFTLELPIKAVQTQSASLAAAG